MLDGEQDTRLSEECSNVRVYHIFHRSDVISNLIKARVPALGAHGAEILR